MINQKKSILIFGAGISGLLIALEFCKKGYEVKILEKNPVVGGIATSIENNGYTMDIGPHYVTLQKNSEITEVLVNMIGKEKIEKLPNNIRRSRKAYFHGRMWDEFPTIYQFISELGIKAWLQLGFTFVKAKIKQSLRNRNLPVTTKDYLISNYGIFLYNNWFKPYYENLFFDKEPSKDLAEKKFPPLNFRKIFDVFNSKNNSSKMYIDNIGYYDCYFKGGMITLIKSLENEIKKHGGKIETNVEIKSIDHNKIKKKISYMKDNELCEISSDVIIYALPLNTAQKWFNQKYQLEKNNEKSNALNSIMVFLFIDSPKVFDRWIIDVYDHDVIFWRIAQQSFLSKTIVPSNKTLLSIEIRAKENSSTWLLDNSLIIDKVKSDLKKIGIIKEEKIDGYKIIKLRNFYPLNPNRISNNTIRDMINSFDNEYAAGTVLDTGTLISDPSEPKTNVTARLGGVFTAMSNAKVLAHNIIQKIEA